jgi:hypothetical protein
MDPNFSWPKAPTMQELCRIALNNPSAWIEDTSDSACKTMHCKRKDDSNQNVIWTHYVSPVEQTLCKENTGRCFRGRCRPNSKILKNRGPGGNCLKIEPFGFMVPAKMVKCPESK